MNGSGSSGLLRALYCSIVASNSAEYLFIQLLDSLLLFHIIPLRCPSKNYGSGLEQNKRRCPIQFQCTGCHKNWLSCLGDLITHALAGLAEEPAGSAWTKAAAFSCRATDSWPYPKTRTATTTILDLVGMCSVSSFAVFLCLNSFLCLHSTDLKQTAPLPPFHCLLSLSSVMYGQQTVDSGQQMPGSSCVRLTALLKNVWRRSSRFMLSRCSRKGCVYIKWGNLVWILSSILWTC